MINKKNSIQILLYIYHISLLALVIDGIILMSYHNESNFYIGITMTFLGSVLLIMSGLVVYNAKKEIPNTSPTDDETEVENSEEIVYISVN